MHPTKKKIALLNDKARKGLLPGSTKMMLTRTVAALPDEAIAHLRRTVAEFDGFTEDNDPYGERDFGAIELEGERYWCPECEDHPRRLVLRRDFENGRGESKNPPISGVRRSK